MWIYLLSMEATAPHQRLPKWVVADRCPVFRTSVGPVLHTGPPGVFPRHLTTAKHELPCSVHLKALTPLPNGQTLLRHADSFVSHTDGKTNEDLNFLKHITMRGITNFDTRQMALPP